MEILLGVLASLAGVIVGGVLQHITSQRSIDRQHAWERSRLVHEKLELIAQVSTEVGGTLSNVYFNAIVAVESGERYKTEVNIPLAKLEMLLNFYAPELKMHYKQLIVLRDEMGSTIADLVSGRLPTVKAEKQALNEKLIKASFKASKICEKLTAEASQLGRKSLELKAEQSHAADARSSRG
ncbi:hypothetical protein [Desulfonatronum thiodismutans]|uniref:hypothetical protein n=1 Tax=Desulfonatronum thiodismutans TaxID=159290 RepID=UPI0004ABE370|nr:hypothetical protein [Desulfonatronum thiodismutans]